MALFSSCSTPEKIGKSKNFREGKFHNLGNTSPKSFSDFLKWRLTRKPGAWPDSIPATAPGKKPAERNLPHEISFTLVGHATILIQAFGLNVLTDPVWSDRVSPLSFVGPKRYRSPGLALEELPPIDFIVISHNHYDHLDFPTLKRLAKSTQAKVLVGLGNGPLVQEAGFPPERVVEMDWWDREIVAGSTITFVPAQHWSARGLFDHDKTMWGGFVISSAQGQSVYFAGDTGYGDFLGSIAEKFPSIQLSFLPIGAYEPRWFMKMQHMNPEDAVKAHQTLGSRKSVGIHYGTFALADEGMEGPEKALKQALLPFPTLDFSTVPFGTAQFLKVSPALP